MESMVTGALADLSYLTRTETRIHVLDRLVDQGPVSREQLRDDGIARETLRRTLAEFETRGWAAATGNRWRPTPLGAHITGVVTTCLDEMAVATEVVDAVALLPSGARALGMEPYLDAEVFTPHRATHSGPCGERSSRFGRRRRSICWPAR